MAIVGGRGLLGVDDGDVGAGVSAFFFFATFMSMTGGMFYCIRFLIATVSDKMNPSVFQTISKHLKSFKVHNKLFTSAVIGF